MRKRLRGGCHVILAYPHFENVSDVGDERKAENILMRTEIFWRKISY